MMDAIPKKLEGDNRLEPNTASLADATSSWIALMGKMKIITIEATATPMTILNSSLKSFNVRKYVTAVTIMICVKIPKYNIFLNAEVSFRVNEMVSTAINNNM